MQYPPDRKITDRFFTRNTNFGESDNLIQVCDSLWNDKVVFTFEMQDHADNYCFDLESMHNSVDDLNRMLGLGPDHRGLYPLGSYVAFEYVSGMARGWGLGKRVADSRSYDTEKNIHMKWCFVNPDTTHNVNAHTQLQTHAIRHCGILHEDGHQYVAAQNAAGFGLNYGKVKKENWVNQ